LKYDDRYARESICEEAARTNYTHRLLQNLTNSEETAHKKSLEMLTIMHSLHFSAPLYHYAESGQNDAIKTEINMILEGRSRRIQE
jgi:hypothetical protein